MAVTASTHTPVTTSFADQAAVRELRAVSVARIMPWRYSWPHASTATIARM